MPAAAIRYPDWKAPAEDGATLIWPAPAELLSQTRQNQGRLATESARLAGVPLREVRSAMRQFVGHDDSAPLLASGHQTELYHPGVWAKDALIHFAAARLGGEAMHLAVDTDSPKHLNLRWPGASVPLTDDPRSTSAAWSGLLEAPTPAHLQSVRGQFEEAAGTWTFQPQLAPFIDAIRRLSLESRPLSAALTNAQHEVDWDLGLRHHALLASPLWMSAPFLLFVHHAMSLADQFAADYNAALHEYRDAHGMKTATRPMPDLFLGSEAIEMPFWLDDLRSGRRARPSVFRLDGGWVLQLPDDDARFEFDSSQRGWEAATRLSRFLSDSGRRLAPRALMLTMFVRLCLADQFVHGIGGGRYDQITDTLIRRHLGIEPPTFCVTTATLFFPGAGGQPRACVPCVQHEGHRLRHELLGERKMKLVRQIDALPRRSPQRLAVFQDMHHQLAAATRSSPAVDRWREKLLDTRNLWRAQQTLLDRELYYLIQPRDRLERLIEHYGRAFDL